MTITYQNGPVVEAVMLSSTATTMRVAVMGCDDAVKFNRVKHVWISEDLEAVEIRFAWERQKRTETVSVDDCICPKELAAKLIDYLVNGKPVQRAMSASGDFGFAA